MLSDKTRINSTDPIRRTVTVTPSDDNDIELSPAQGLLVTAAGDVVFVCADDADDNTTTITGCQVGDFINFAVRRVLATGTTATVKACY